MKLTLITHGGEYADRILVGLALKGIIVDKVIIVLPPKLSFSSIIINSNLRLPLVLAKEMARRLLRSVRYAFLKRDVSWIKKWDGLSGQIESVYPSGNNENVLAEMESPRPDILILGGISIVGKEVLAIPKRGTLNVHPALIPWIRGSSGIENSIRFRVPVGISAHFVDPGIDTGDTIHRELIPVSDADTIFSLRRKAYERASQLMIELVQRLSNGWEAVALKQKERFPLCSSLTFEAINRLNLLVREGLALQLYHEWHNFFGSDILPPCIEKHPPVDILPINKS